MKIQISARAKVIEAAVHLEANISLYLCTYLNVDQKRSLLFGFKRGCLSFDSKLAMLLELNYFTSEKRDKFKQFSEIRNKFAHVATIINFTDCYNSISGSENKLNRWYPDIKPSLIGEDKNKELYVRLKEELLDDLLNFQLILKKAEKRKKDINYNIAYVQQINQIMREASSENKMLKKIFDKIQNKARRNAKIISSETNISVDYLGVDINMMSLV